MQVSDRLGLILIAVLVAGVISAPAQNITAYGYPGDLTPDSNSSNGVGNRNNKLVPFGSAAVTSAALSPEYAFQRGIALGQQFTQPAANGQTYNLRYDDTKPDSGGDQTVDIYDPNSLLTQGGNDNNFKTTANGMPTVDQGPNAASPLGSANGILGFPFGPGPSMNAFLDNLLAKYKSAGQRWEAAIYTAAVHLFWILAGISLFWTGAWMAIKQADLVEIVAELCRFIMVTGLFFWLLLNGTSFAAMIIASLRQLGGEATGTNGFLEPGAILTVGFKIFQQTVSHINLLEMQASMVPFVMAVVILIVLTLVTVNVVLLLVAAWIVVYAGLIFLGFGGCRWTSDMAVAYYRTILGIGVMLLTMELLIGIGTTFVQDLVDSIGQGLNPATMAVIMAASVILLVMSHRLPPMVAGIVTGAAHNGGIGVVGFMTAVAAIGANRIFGSASQVMRAIGSNGDSPDGGIQARIDAADAAESARQEPPPRFEPAIQTTTKNI
jgi:P-type conjugative transfer protein TrbL